MFKEISIRTVPVTKDVAKEWSSMERWDGERPLDQTRVSMLKSKLRDGVFHAPVWASAWLAGKKYRANGQHSSVALSEFDGDFPANLTLIIKEFVCDTSEDMAILFAQFDLKQSVRSERDTLNSHKGLCRDLDPYSITTVKYAVDGIGYFAVGATGQQQLTGEDRARLMYEYKNFIHWVAPFITPGLLRRTAIVSAMFATWQINPVTAITFWTYVAKASHPKADNASRILHQFIRDLIGATSIRVGRMRVRWTPRAIYAKSIHAWNAYLYNETTNLAYFENSPLPEAKRPPLVKLQATG